MTRCARFFIFVFLRAGIFPHAKNPYVIGVFRSSEKFSRKRALAFRKFKRALTLRVADCRRLAFLSLRTPFGHRGKCFFRCAGVIGM
jgi:hypothetical protein